MLPGSPAISLSEIRAALGISPRPKYLTALSSLWSVSMADFILKPNYDGESLVSSRDSSNLYEFYTQLMRKASAQLFQRMYKIGLKY